VRKERGRKLLLILAAVVVEEEEEEAGRGPECPGASRSPPTPPLFMGKQTSVSNMESVGRNVEEAPGPPPGDTLVGVVGVGVGERAARSTCGRRGREKAGGMESQ